MARPYTGKVSTRIREQKQKNGTIYVIEEKRQYNPEKKYTETIESKLLAGVSIEGSEVAQDSY